MGLVGLEFKDCTKDHMVKEVTLTRLGIDSNAKLGRCMYRCQKNIKNQPEKQVYLLNSSMVIASW